MPRFFAPAKPRIVVLATYFAAHWRRHAAAAVTAPDATELIGVSLTAKGSDRGHYGDPQVIETSLLLFFFFGTFVRNKGCVLQTSRSLVESELQEVISLLAPTVGWENLLSAAVVEGFSSVHHSPTERSSLLEWVIKRGVNINSRPCRLTPLQAAVQLWDLKVVTLLKNCANINSVGSPNGYNMPGTSLDYESVYSSPLRMLRRASPAIFATAELTSMRSEEASLDIEKLLLGAGARDFTGLREATAPTS